MSRAIGNRHESDSVVYIDMGTTNTRVWLIAEDKVIGRAHAQVGVGDTARDGSTTRLRTVLKELILEVCSGDARPSYVAAAGMITSSLGLVEIPHVEAPAGLEELQRSLES